MLQRLGSISLLNQRLLLILICAVLFGLWVWRVPLVEPDETRYVESTREMVETGHFIIPQCNYIPRYQKPILFYWIQAASVSAFGQSEFAARLPSALLALLLVLILHSLLLRLLGAWARNRDPDRRASARGAAFLGASALALLPLFALWTRVGITDITLTFFTTGALFALLLAAVEPEHARRWYLLAALSCGLAFLTKGPIGIAIPGLVWLLFHLRHRSLLQELRRVPWLLAILVVLLVNLPWYLSTYFVDGPGFLRQFFLTENAGRFAEGTRVHKSLGDNIGEALTFIAGVFTMVFPGNAFFVHEVTAPFSGNSELRASELITKIRSFCLIWIVAVVGLFACSQTRGLNYAQTISAAVAMLFAVHVLGRFSTDPARVTGRARTIALVIERSILLFFGTAWFAILGYVIHRGRPFHRSWETPFPPQLAQSLFILTIALGAGFLLVSIYLWLKRNDWHALIWTMGCWAAFLAVLLVGFAPMFFTSAFAPVAVVGNYVRNLYPNEPLATFTNFYTLRPDVDPLKPENPENIIYYARRPVQFHISTDKDVVGSIHRTLEQHGAMLLVTDAPGLAAVTPFAQIQLLKQYDYFIVAHLTSIPTATAPVVRQAGGTSPEPAGSQP